jgi:hypothetical protein
MALSGGGGGITMWNFKSSISPAAMSEAMFSEAIEKNDLLMATYLVGLVALGVFTGLLAYRLPIRIEEEQQILDAMDPKPDLAELGAPPAKKTKRLRKEKKKQKKKDFTLKQLRIPAILAAVGILDIFKGHWENGWKMISYGILFLVIFTEFLPQFFVPMVQQFMLRLFNDERIDPKHTTGAMTELKASFWAAWRLAGQTHHNWTRRAERFVPLFFALALEYDAERPTSDV